MALKIIGAGLGRTATFSLKFALEHLGFGPCYHMTEVLAAGRRNVPLWLAAVEGRPDWEAIFDGFGSTTDYPACTYWRELAAYYPSAKVVLTVRDPDSWFDSVSETIFSGQMRDSLAGTPVEAMMNGAIFAAFEGRVKDRAFMTPKEGWNPLCDFLGVPVPSRPFPRVNSRDELTHASNEQGGVPPDPDAAERFAREYIDQLKAKAFAAR
jgi:hypothetical protein